MVAELSGCEPLHEAIPRLAASLDGPSFAALKRRLIAETARITATLHGAGLFHKDLYLCHFFLDIDRLGRSDGPSRIVLIDLHRLRKHRLWPDWWRWKDLGQLLFSTDDVAGIDDQDRWRFWRRYCQLVGLRWPSCQAWLVRFRAARYASHNRKRR
jgi:heptose I phosphotransferase